MQHAVDPASASAKAEHTQPSDHTSAMIPQTGSPSSTSSPKSEKASLGPNASQASESMLPSILTHELTPPSSVASSVEQQDVDFQSGQENRRGDMAAPAMAMGKKRTANGQVKESAMKSAESINGLGHASYASTLPQASNVSLGELSQQLRTKLTYAMVKVQNGWQQHSLDEIESIASHSPRSNLSGFASREYQSLVSPRAALSANQRHGSDASSSSESSLRHTQPNFTVQSAPEPSMLPTRKTLAPPAAIVSGNRRRPAPNVHLQINSLLQPGSRPNRPTTTQRTPSQNAAMEADAVETLLFMSASPSNSAHFPSHLSAYSPVSQVFSAQTSPVKPRFGITEREYSASAVEYSPHRLHRRVHHEDKATLIDRLLNELDDDESKELDRAVQIMDQHHVAKLST